MSKIFRRPMFRKGGNVGEGIMTGIVDRGNYEVGGSASERLMKVMQDYPVQTVDPIAELLISAGLRGFSETGGGSTFGNLAKAFEDPTQQYFKRVGEQGKAKRDLALAGAQLDIEQEQAEKLARIKAKDKDVYAAQLYETQVEKMRDNLVDAAEARIISKFKGAKADDISRKTTDFIMQAPSSLKSNLIDIDYVDVGKKGVSQYVPDLANVQVGQIFYDATLGQWKKRVGEGQGRLDFVTLDSYSGYKEIEIDQ
jgi:hypothetical protein